MIEDPYTYDITDFAREFTWSIIFWNLAETNARWLLAGILGGKAPVHALVADLGSRSLADALRSAARGLEDETMRLHIEHFCKGYNALGEHRNLYVHGLASLGMGEPDANNVKPMHGYIMTTKGRGRWKTIDLELPTTEISKFKDYCQKLLNYGKAITNHLGLADALEGMLGMPEPSLEMPEWPAPPATRIQHIQD